MTSWRGAAATGQQTTYSGPSCDQSGAGPCRAGRERLLPGEEPERQTDPGEGLRGHAGPHLPGRGGADVPALLGSFPVKELDEEGAKGDEEFKSLEEERTLRQE